MKYGIAAELWINIFICIRWLALRKADIHASSAHEGSIYLIIYVLVVVVCCCKVLGFGMGSGYCNLVTVFWMIKMMGCQSDWLILLWLVQKVIGWCRYILIELHYDVVDGSSLKIYETWSLEEKEKVVAFYRLAPTCQANIMASIRARGLYLPSSRGCKMGEGCILLQVEACVLV